MVSGSNAYIKNQSGFYVHSAVFLFDNQIYCNNIIADNYNINTINLCLYKSVSVQPMCPTQPMA